MKIKKKINKLFLISLAFSPILISCTNVSNKEEIKYYNFSISATEGGSISGNGDGKYEENTEISLSALVFEDYIFSGYYENDTLISENTSYSFKLTKNTSLLAKFSPKENDDENKVDEDEKDQTPETKIEKFSHVFKVDEIKGAKKSINGVEIESSTPTYSSQISGKGVQIGSKNNPQLKPLTINFSFPENVKLLNLSANLATAQNGSGRIEVECGSYKDNLIINSANNKDYSFDAINSSSTSFLVSLSSTIDKAIYLYSIDFEIETAYESSIVLTVDKNEGQKVEPGKNGIPSINYSLNSYNKETYYANLNASLTGDSLRKNINGIISEMTKFSYDNCKYALCYTDENPLKPGYLYGIFDGDDISAIWDTSWNREHVWPCAHMNIDGTKRPGSSTKNHMTDLFNLRASCQTINSYHSDKYYDSSNSATTFYPVVDSTIINGIHNFTGDFRGDVARTTFYMYARYLDLSLIENIENDTTTTSMGRLSELKKWHKEDPVDDFELQRNNRVYEYQGNRNPFIDYPNLVDNLF